jgi:hypothetical protein
MPTTVATGDAQTADARNPVHLIGTDRDACERQDEQRTATSLVPRRCRGTLGGSCKRPACGRRRVPGRTMEDIMSEQRLIDATGRLRSPAATPGHWAGCAPPNKGLRYPDNTHGPNRQAALMIRGGTGPARRPRSTERLSAQIGADRSPPRRPRSHASDASERASLWRRRASPGSG